MNILSGQDDRVERRYTIQFLPVGPASPKVLIPAETSDPFAGLFPFDETADPFECFLDRGYAIQVDRRQAEAITAEMGVRVDEGGYDGPAAEVDDFGLRSAADFTDLGDPSRQYRDGGCRPIEAGACLYPAVRQKDIRFHRKP